MDTLDVLRIGVELKFNKYWRHTSHMDIFLADKNVLRLKSSKTIKKNISEVWVIISVSFLLKRPSSLLFT